VTGGIKAFKNIYIYFFLFQKRALRDVQRDIFRGYHMELWWDMESPRGHI